MIQKISFAFSLIISKIAAVHRLRIPTIIGLLLIMAGVGFGVYGILQKQGLTAKASADQTPQNIIVSNIEENQAAISWQTNSPSSGFIKFGQNSAEETTVLDDRDQGNSQNRSTHHVTIKNLNPQTIYKYRIISGAYQSELSTFTTASPSSSQNGFQPVIGIALDGKTPISDGIAYLVISGAVIQSTVIKDNGSFIIPLSLIRQESLSNIFSPTTDTSVKITVFSDSKNGAVLIKLNNTAQQVIPIHLGDNLDLTQQQTIISQPPNLDLAKFDLNGDGQINSSDYSIVLKNFDKNPKDKRADLNGDGVVDQKDLKLIMDKINPLQPTP